VKKLSLKGEYSHQVKIIMILGIFIGLSWGFCMGILFEQARSRPKPRPPALAIMRGIEF